MTTIICGLVGRFEPSSSELTSDQIVERYGPLIQGAVQAFDVDYVYLVRMAEVASLIHYKRKLWEARMQAKKCVAGIDEIRAKTLEILAEDGITPPRSKVKVA